MSAALALGASSHADAQTRDTTPTNIDIAATSLADAIAELAGEARISIGIDAPLPTIPVRALRGRMTVREALSRLLSGTGLIARPVAAAAWRIERAPAPPRRPAPAVTPMPSTQPTPEPILVTGTKRSIDLLSLPAAVAVVGEIPRDGNGPTQSSQTIASQIEGLALTARGPGRNRMFLRGVADSAFGGESQSTVAVVLDDTHLTYAAPDPDIRLVDMDRVEVLKGPQGSLYGTGALGGIYHMVTHQADLQEDSLELTSGISAVDHGGVGFSGSATANFVLSPGTAAIRAVGYASDEPGWIDTGSRSNTNWTRTRGARVLLALVPVEGWRINLKGFGQWLDTHDSRYVYDRNSVQRPAQQNEPNNTDLIHISGQLIGQIGEVNANLSSAMTWHEASDRLDATVGADAFGLEDPQSLLDDRRYTTWDMELRLQGRWRGAGWLFGVSRLDANQLIDTTLVSASGTSVTLKDDRRDSHDTAAYLDLTVPLTNTLSFDGGARLFYSSVKETRTLSAGGLVREEDKIGVTPTLALSWHPRSTRQIYLRYGSAFRQGGLNISSSGRVEKLEGDELASIEAGWREHLSGGGLAEIGAWYSLWKDLQSDALTDEGLIETVNAGDARIFGIEGSLSLPVSRGWQLQAGANATNSQLTRNTLGYEVHDRRLPVVPDYTLRASVRHDLALGSLDAWIKLGLRYVGPAHMSFDPALDRRMGNALDSALEFHLSKDRWALGANVNNLFNNKKNVFAFGNPLRYRSMEQYTPQQPRTISLDARMGF